MPPVSSNASLARLQARRKPYKVGCGGGLYLLVFPNETRAWRLKYRYGGRENTLSLGLHPTITLAAARKQRDLLKQQLREGIDPAIERRESRARAREQRRKRPPPFAFSMSETGEFRISTRRQSIRLTASQTDAIRTFLKVEAQSRSDTEE